MVGLGAAVAALAPDLSAIALRRLFIPMGPDRWPQQTHLSLIDRETPRKVARGDAFTLAVSVAPSEKPPAKARVTYRFEDGETQTESLSAVEGGTFRGRIETVDRPFSFSVAAGDDTSSIRDIDVRVVPPPVVNDLTVRLVAPSYTRLPPSTMAPGRNQVRAVNGTRIELQGLTNKPIARAELRLGEKASAGPVALDAARTTLTTSFDLTESVSFWFDMVDTEGFKNREAVRTDVRAFNDEAPRVTIEEPPHDRDIPAKATVPVVFQVSDDFGIHSARLIYKVAAGGSEPTQEVALPLWAADQSATGPGMWSSTRKCATRGTSPR